jgi:hypothetical protein
MTSVIRLTEMDVQPILTTAKLLRVPAADFAGLINEAIADPDRATMYMRLFYLFQALGQREFALDFEKKALALRSVYRAAGSAAPAIRLLALMAPGGARRNSPLDFIVEDGDIRLDMLFVSPYQPLPQVIPDHDIAIVAMNEADLNQPLLARVKTLFALWPRPMLNRPEHIGRCARHATWPLLNDIAGMKTPRTERVRREQVVSIPFPITIRPVDTHAGQGLEKIDTANALPAYYERHPEAEFYVAQYVDYRSPDGLFRKYRIALIGGEPYLCHLAISDHWVVHYQSAGMDLSASKRSEEASVMKRFAHDFALRHARALAAVAQRLGLDYVVLDCAEMPDGRLLFFEADVAGWIHALDALGLSDKRACMQKAFGAFRQLLVERYPR